MEAIDRAYLAAQTFGDEALSGELLALFAAQCRRILPMLADSARSRGERADLAHTLKGSAAGIGARPLAECCGTVEACLRDAGEPDLAGLSAAAARALRAIDAPP